MKKASLTERELANLWESRDSSFKGVLSPKDLPNRSFSWATGVEGPPGSMPRRFTVGHEPLNEYGRGWYPYQEVYETSSGWMVETVHLEDHL